MDTHGRNASRFACLMRSHLARAARSARPRDGAFACTPRRVSADLGAACLWRGRSLRPSGLEPATGAAVAALIPAIIRVIYNCRSYKSEGRPLIYIDEAGFANHMPRKHGYSVRGEGCYGVLNWKPKKTTNAIVTSIVLFFTDGLSKIYYLFCPTRPLSLWIKPLCTKELTFKRIYMGLDID